MGLNRQFSLDRFGRDRLFWLIVGGLFLLYALFVLRLNALQFVATMLALLLAITVHECAHAWVADQLGDPTARYLGRVSLNPLAHLDPLGTIMMVMTAITGMGIGWGKPVPVTPYRLRHGPRLGGGMVSLAGPVSNLTLALLLGLVLRLVSGLPPLAYVLVDIIVWTNILLALFNLLPIPPLDGSGVLLGLLSLSNSAFAWRISQFVARMQQQGPMIFIGLILITQLLGLNLLGWVIGPPARFFHRLFVGR